MNPFGFSSTPSTLHHLPHPLHSASAARHRRKSSVSISPPFSPTPATTSNPPQPSTSPLHPRLTRNSLPDTLSPLPSPPSSSTQSDFSTPSRSTFLSRKASLDSLPAHLRRLRLSSSNSPPPQPLPPPSDAHQSLQSPSNSTSSLCVPSQPRRQRSSSASSAPRPHPLLFANIPTDQPHRPTTPPPLLPLNPSKSIPSIKKAAPPPLDLTASTSTSAHSTPAPARPPTPQSNGLSSPVDAVVDVSPASIWPFLITSPTDQPPHPESTIEDEERKAAEWYGSASPDWPDAGPSTSAPHFEEVYDPMLIMAGQDDHGLTTTEKIFLFAKSQNAYHRVIISQRLPELLEEVDLSEAVEYVLPLLSGLATDDEAIREALGPSLCNIMWYFFSKCPISELDLGPLDLPTPSTSASASISSLQKRPSIVLSSFTPLLITLLTDSSESIALLVRFGLLTFLARLRGHDSPAPTWVDFGLVSSDAYLPVTSTEDAGYEPYSIGPAQRLAIVLEIIDGVVLALCRTGISTASLPRACEKDGAWDTVPLTDNDEPQSSLIDDVDPKSNIRTYFESSPAPEPTSFEDAANFFTPCPAFLRDTLSSTSEHPQGAAQMAARRQIGLSLIGSIIESGCAEPDVVSGRLLPQVARAAIIRHESSRLVRQQAAVTLNLILSISSQQSTAPSDGADDNVLVDTFQGLAADPDADVRKQACFGLPSFIRIAQGKRHAAELFDKFASDDHRDVRLVASQVLGEVIYGYKSSTVPDQLIKYFVHGFPKDIDEEERQRTFGLVGPFSQDGFGVSIRSSGTAFGSCTNLANLTGGAASHTNSFSTLMSPPISATDIERAMCRAFNFPAVLLTLGPERWPQLRALFLELTSETRYPSQVRRSLACSVHEIIKILADGDLSDCVTVLEQFLFSEGEGQVVEAVLENLHTSLEPLSRSTVIKILDGLRSLSEEDERGAVVGWRVREQLAKLLPALWDCFGSYEEAVAIFEDLLRLGLCDGAAAVRAASLQFFPILYQSGSATIRSRLLNFSQQLALNPNYRIRMTYPNALLSLVRLPMSLEAFEGAVKGIEQIAHDRVGGVRIGVARLLAELPSFYGHQRLPGSLMRIIDSLRTDAELVVRDFVERIRINEDGPESLEERSSSEDDLTGSGIEVFGNRLSEDEGEEVGGLEESSVCIESLESPPRRPRRGSHGSPISSLWSFRAAPVIAPEPSVSVVPMSNNGNAAASGGGAAQGGLWMRETDGGFVEVGGEY